MAALVCDRSAELERRLAIAESLLLEAAWAFRHLTPGGDQQAAAYAIAVHVQDYEQAWHERRQAAEPLPVCIPHQREGEPRVIRLP